MNRPSPQTPSRRFGRRAPATFYLLAMLGLLPMLPVMIKGSPILNNDMLVAYFSYFWDFHRNWSWSQPLVFWSSSYQCGMPMHAYWQSGYLYPVTWALFGPISPHYGIYLFYAFHFSLGIFGFLKLGPRLGLHRTASWWAGICFALSGTMLARYEHATFLSGWAWIPLVLAAFLALRDAPGPRTFFLYAACVALQALGGHPQASVTTAILIGAFTVRSVTPMLPSRMLSRLPSRQKATPYPPSSAPAPRGRRAAWILGGHLLALVYCAPMLIPFVQMVGQTDRFDGVAWEGVKPGAPTDGKAATDQSSEAARAGAVEKLEDGVFGFEKFATGGMRPIHLLSLAAPHALGSPSNASWWGGEVWGEVFVYLGGLGLFFCFFASPKRARPDLRWVWILGAVGLWLSFGAHLGASQIQYHIPVLNNFRRPARFLILFAFAMAALSGHGLQRWLGHPKGGRTAGRFAIAALLLGGGFAALRFLPEFLQSLLASVKQFKHLDPTKDYGAKLSALLGRGAIDCAFLACSAAAIWWHGREWRVRRRQALTAKVASASISTGSRSAHGSLSPRYGLSLLFLVLLADLLRLHWDHFYLFPSDYYRKPPATIQAMDQATSPYWRVSHYLEYPGLEMWEMHNDPVKHFNLLEREKDALSCGIHAIFGYRHVTAHLPLLWQWDPTLTPAEKSTRYLFSNRDLDAHREDALRLIGQYRSVKAFELVGWRPRLETASHGRAEGELMRESPESRDPEIRSARNRTECQTGYSGYGGLCVREPRDGEFQVSGEFAEGDTLIIRERFNPEWRYRIDAGEWKVPVETSDRFTALPVDQTAGKIEMVYYPKRFYQISGLALLLTVGLGGWFRFRKHPR